MYTDSKLMLESIASSRQIDRKTLRMTVRELKEIESYQWLPTHEMWADVLTKEKKIPEGLKDVFVKNKMRLVDTSVNRVVAFN